MTENNKQAEGTDTKAKPNNDTAIFAGGQNQRPADTEMGKQHLSEAFVPGLLPTLHPDLHIFKR